MAKDARRTEAVLKYYLLGAFLGLVMFTGTAVLFGVGRLDPLPTVAAFATTVPKVGAILAFYRFINEPLSQAPGDWRLVTAILAAVTMTLGNLAAFQQDSVRRLLDYSTISRAGYLLMVPAVAGRTSLALPALAIYVGAYVLINVGAFAVVAAAGTGPSIADWKGTDRRSPLLAFSWLVCLLGLVAPPPTEVFVGKLTVFITTAQGGYGWLVVIAAVNTVASLYYSPAVVGAGVRPAERPCPTRGGRRSHGPKRTR